MAGGGKGVKILLVQPQLNQPIKWAQSPSYALLILGTLAEQRGHKVKVLHLDIDTRDIRDQINLFNPDLVGITCNTFQVRSAKEVALRARAFGAKVVVGGPHASAWDGYADTVVIGEGENRWLQIIGSDPCINTIDDIPPINYDLVDLSRFCGISPVGASPSMCIIASRGCPSECTFCNTPVFWGKKVRYRSPELVLDEVKLLHNKYGAQEIFFQDDTFNLNHKWASQIFEGIIREGLHREMVFKICCRVSERLITKEFLELASRAGVWNIFYGVESGSQKMLDRMKKGITVEEVKRAFKMTHEANIVTQASFIIGLPGETTKTLQETADLIALLVPTKYGWVKACPFPNTEFRKEVVEKGHILDWNYEEYGYGKAIVRTDEISFEELDLFGGFKIEGGLK